MHRRVLTLAVIPEIIMHNTRRIRSLLMYVWILLAGTVALAQVTSRVTGVVSDPQGAMVSGATVTLTNEATGVPFNAATSSAGTYVFDAVKPGTYTVRIEAAGFKKFVSTGNVLTIGLPMTVNAQLVVGSLNEQVTVIGSAEQVQTATSGNYGELFDNTALNILPIVTGRGRNPLELVELEPGVVDGSGFNQGGANIAGGGVYANGARDRAWNYTLDGVDANETSAGGSNFSPLHLNPDMLSEFRVITSNATAEYGRNSGAEVVMTTKYGTNQFHGDGYFYYQTPGFDANDPGSKEAGLGRPQFVQKIYGFDIGGPVFKNKTFFFANFQWLRLLHTTLNSQPVFTQPARGGLLRFVDQNSPNCLSNGACANTAAGSSGATVDSSGNPVTGVNIDSYDVAANDPLSMGLDPSVQAMVNGSKIPLPNDFFLGDGLNVAAFDWLAAEHEKQIDFTIRIDHTFNASHSVFGRWSAGHQNTFGDTANAGLAIFPGFPNTVDTFRTPKNLAVNWRWIMNPRLLNEFVVGMSRFSFNFANPDPNFRNNPAFNFFADPICAINGLACMSVPLQNYVGNARFLTTFQLVDNMSYERGAHAFKWGVNFRYQRHIDQRGSIGNLDASPAINFDPSINTPDPTTFNYGSMNIDQSQDFVDLQGFINDLLGRVGAIQQGVVAQNPTTWAPPGTILHADFRMPEYDLFAQDTWRIRPNFVVDLGLRWELKPSPRVTNTNNMLRPNTSFGWGQSSTTLSWQPGQLYRDSMKNFGPSIGFAWDPHNDGKTSIRGNFRVAYDRINTFSLSSAIFQNMPGLSNQIFDTTFGTETTSCGGTDGRFSTLTPSVFDCVISSNLVQTPTQLRTPPPFSNNQITVVDPNWKPPQTYMWSFGFQRELPKKIVLEVNYLGRKAIHLYGGYDANQAKIRANGFLSAFNTVAALGDSPLMDQLLQADPNFPGGSITGSQWAQTPGSTYNSDLVNGRVARMAARLQQAGTDVAAGLPPTFFLSYPQFSGSFPSGPGGFIVLDSRDYSTYNSLQAVVRRSFENGLTFQASYVWSKSIDTRSFDPTFSTVVVQSSPFGASSTPFDNDNRKRNYAPSDFDRTHVFQGIWTYDLPFGHGKRWASSLNGVLDRIVGGWTIGGFGIIESGRPTTFFSGSNDYTLSSIVRTVADCTGCSPNMAHIHRDPGTGLLTYFTPAQIAQFSTPAPGQFSNVGRNFFRLAGYNILNLSLAKNFRVKEGQQLQLRFEVHNALNSVHYDEPGSNRYNNGDFGVVDPLTVQQDGRSLSSDFRQGQLSVRYTF
jgi:Carboxypeptidase regulatory-like domain/TonB-dependent Receptor Plug Domain